MSFLSFPDILLIYSITLLFLLNNKLFLNAFSSPSWMTLRVPPAFKSEPLRGFAGKTNPECSLRFVLKSFSMFFLFFPVGYKPFLKFVVIRVNSRRYFLLSSNSYILNSVLEICAKAPARRPKARHGEFDGRQKVSALKVLLLASRFYILNSVLIAFLFIRILNKFMKIKEKDISYENLH